MSDDVDTPKVTHLHTGAVNTGPAMNFTVGLVHKLGEEGRGELQEALTLAIEEVARRYGWTPQP